MPAPRPWPRTKSTCVVFGMPKVAIDLGGVDRAVPLDRIPQEIIAYGRQ